MMRAARGDGAADFDVIVVGGGVAGLSSALALAQRRRVLLCEKADGVRPAGGETLISAADRLLSELGFSDRPQHIFAPRFGAASAWGSPSLEHRDGFLDPRGAGWRLQRAAFEARLQAQARACGVAFAPPFTSATREAGGDWRLEGCGRVLRARFLVDATGRAGVLARALGAGSAVAIDNLVCRTVRLRGQIRVPDLDGFSLVEAVSEGWWHRATDPDGALVISFFTDADRPAARTMRDPVGFAAALAQTRHARRGVDFEGAGGWRTSVLSARSQRLPSAAGEGWCAVGDAAIALDPLSSAGLFNALYLAARATRAIEARLEGDQEALPGYAAEVDRIWRAFIVNRCAVYGDASRFAGEPFWRRRVTGLAAAA